MNLTKIREELTYWLQFEPIRSAAGTVVTVLAGLTAAGVTLPAWVLAAMVLLAGEVARLNVAPLPTANARIGLAYQAGQQEGARAILNNPNVYVYEVEEEEHEAGETI